MPDYGDRDMRVEFKDTEITKMLDAMIGNTSPAGETLADEAALERLKVLEAVTDWCMDAFNYARKGKYRYEWSMKQVGEEAIKYLKNTYDWIGAILREDERHG